MDSTGAVPGGSSRPAWLPSFVVLATIWGSSFAFVHIALRSLSPIQVAAGRVWLGAAALLIVAIVTRTRLPRSRACWLHLAVVGALLNAVPFTLFAVGQQHISSVLAGTINSATPLATLAVIIVAFPEERPTPERIVGLAIGFTGVLIVLGAWRGFSGGALGGVLACFGAVCSYGVAFPYARRHLSSRDESPVALAAGQVGTAALQMLVVTLVAGVRPAGDLNVDVVVAMLALGIFGSGLAYVLNYRIVELAGASTASTVTYLTPVVAVIIGVVVLGERVLWNQLVGGAIVLGGLAVAQGRLGLWSSRSRAGA